MLNHSQTSETAEQVAPISLYDDGDLYKAGNIFHLTPQLPEGTKCKSDGVNIMTFS